MPLVKSLVSVVIRTTIGHCIEVSANTPTYVPPEVMKFTAQHGCAECNEAGELVAPKPKEKAAPVGDIPLLSSDDRGDPSKRMEVIILAVTKVYEANNRDDFTLATNQPKVKAVERVVGFPITGHELAAALDRMQAD